MTAQHSSASAVVTGKLVTDQSSWLSGMQVSTSLQCTFELTSSCPAYPSPTASTSSTLAASLTPSSIAGSLPLTFCSPVLSPHSIRGDDMDGQQGRAPVQPTPAMGSLHSANSRSDNSLLAHMLPADSLLERSSSMPQGAANRAQHATSVHPRPLPRLPTFSHLPPSRSISLDHKVHRGMTVGEEKRMHGGVLKSSPKKALSAMAYFSADPTSARIVAATDPKSLGMVLTPCGSLGTLHGLCKASSGCLNEDTRLALSQGTSLAASSSTLSVAVSRAGTDAGLGDLLGPFASTASQQSTVANMQAAASGQESAGIFLWPSQPAAAEQGAAIPQAAGARHGSHVTESGSSCISLGSSPAIPIIRPSGPSSNGGSSAALIMAQTSSSSHRTPSAFANLPNSAVPAASLHPTGSGGCSLQVLSPSPSLGAVYKVYYNSASPQASPTAGQTGMTRLLERSLPQSE